MTTLPSPRIPVADSSTPLLDVAGLSVTLPVAGARRRVLDDVSLRVAAGEAIGLVGESGSGKSMTAKAIARLLPDGAEATGSIRFDGTEVLGLRGSALRDYRRAVGVVFQDPRSHINPVRSIGDFLTEALRTNHGIDRATAERRATDLLGEVGVDDPRRRLGQYPHELSGGMLQRVMIASVLLAEPRLLLADEPTTALDVTTQSEVMAILDELRRDRSLAMLFITHDLDLAAAVCDRTVVLYAGQVMEERVSDLLHDDPLHPYTAGLVRARPSLDAAAETLPVIPGRPRSAFEAPAGCGFSDRCAHAADECHTSRPGLQVIDGGVVRCHRADELRGGLGGAT